jgi:ABC-type Mn2+/Zn2+ transport system ATPase subunit
MPETHLRDEHSPKGRAVFVALIALLVAGLVVVTLLSLAVGAIRVPPSSILGALFRHHPMTDTQEIIVLQIRLPRVLASAVVGALEVADVTALQHRVFNELSGGERQRVKIALGFAQQAKLPLLDEPTQNLDIGRQVELIDLLHFLRSEGTTIFASIHDLQLVEGNFSSVVLLSPHTPLMIGTPEETLRPALLEEAFDCRPRHHPLLLERMQRFTRRVG